MSHGSPLRDTSRNSDPVAWCVKEHSGSLARRLLAPVARLMRSVLELAADDPQFARLAATAELIVCEGRSSSWSNPEMEARSELKAAIGVEMSCSRRIR